jgi:hypothetical protein
VAEADNAEAKDNAEATVAEADNAEATLAKADNDMVRMHCYCSKLE